MEQLPRPGQISVPDVDFEAGDRVRITDLQDGTGRLEVVQTLPWRLVLELLSALEGIEAASAQPRTKPT
jgi:hypothetical protein